MERSASFAAIPITHQDFFSRVESFAVSSYCCSTVPSVLISGYLLTWRTVNGNGPIICGSKPQLAVTMGSFRLATASLL
jgi:hypothetical protein